ncbi:hypothetical protein G7054_g556 [Neopestalotiopsis clavispora]|nr:hypothetical protein G7054_g556 [Neopestalotiopsis clavispora]
MTETCFGGQLYDFDDDPDIFNPLGSEWVVETGMADFDQPATDDSPSLELDMQFQQPFPGHMIFPPTDQMFDTSLSLYSYNPLPLESYPVPTMNVPVALPLFDDRYIAPDFEPMMHRAFDMPGAEALAAPDLNMVSSGPGPGI